MDRLEVDFDPSLIAENPMVLGTICEAIRAHALLEFDYHGEHRIVAPYCHGVSAREVEVLRAVQLERARSTSKKGGFGFGKLWSIADMKNVRVTDERFTPRDPDYNPNDSAMVRIHCRA